MNLNSPTFVRSLHAMDQKFSNNDILATCKTWEFCTRYVGPLRTVLNLNHIEATTCHTQRANPLKQNSKTTEPHAHLRHVAKIEGAETR